MNNARQITDGFTYYTYKYNGFSLYAPPAYT